MNKTELIAAVAEKTGLNKKVSEQAISAALELITDSLVNGEKVQLVGFGSFECRERAARQGRNPKTLEVIDVPATRAPAFKPGKALKDAVSGK